MDTSPKRLAMPEQVQSIVFSPSPTRTLLPTRPYFSTALVSSDVGNSLFAIGPGVSGFSRFRTSSLSSFKLHSCVSN
jgi:hypothetical protein